MISEAVLTATRERHHRSVEELVGQARALPELAWERPLGDGKWSPAQIIEHVRMTYQAIGQELAGAPGIQIRTSWWQRLMLRRVLTRILRYGVIPERARAPRETRPGSGPFPRESLLQALTTAAAATEAALVAVAPEGRTVAHHVFGRLRPLQMLEFAATHNRHHARQLGAANTQ